MFKPFDNDHQSMQIGELIFENQTDKVIVYGDIDITKTPIGLEEALRLKTVFTNIVNALESAKLDSTMPSVTTDILLATDKDGLQENNLEPSKQANVNAQTDSSKDIDNPFS